VLDRDQAPSKGARGRATNMLKVAVYECVQVRYTCQIFNWCTQKQKATFSRVVSGPVV